MKNPEPKRSFQKCCSLVLAFLLCISGTGRASAADVQINGDETSGAATAFPWADYDEKDAQWWSSEEAIALADEILECQRPDGGWRRIMNRKEEGNKDRSSLDNNATWGQTLFLAKCYTATGTERYREACLRGICFLLDSQYENGGWPQVPGAKGSYIACVTFNDYVMTGAMLTMKRVSERSAEEGFAWVDDLTAQRAAEALELALRCTLRCQVRVNGRLTAWCQQYDEVTLLPAGGRVYEPAAISTWESADLVGFLQNFPEDPRICKSVEAAVAWFREVRIQGFRFEWVGDDRELVPGTDQDVLWARFYDTETMVPLFSDRSGQIFYDVSEISRERRTGYDWYGTWPLKYCL